MKDWNEIASRLQANEAIAEKFFQVEMRILSILNFRDLFEVLLTEIETIFGLPAVWLALIEDCDAVRLIPLLEAEEGLCSRLVRIRRQGFDSLLQDPCAPLLANRDLKRFAPLFPGGSAGMPLASLAFVPISLDGEVIGSLNLGDTDPNRFSPEMDPGLLRQLGVKVSLCLSNVTAHEKLSFMAYHDALTGLLNRRVMANALNREVDRALRYGHRLSVVFIDVDDFKQVNDTHGHECGDSLLRHLAEILSGCSRASDVVARFAGDEFVLILPESDTVSAQRMMERVCAAVAARPLQTPFGSVPLEISFGIASLQKDAQETPEELLERADRQLYRAKRVKKPRTVRNPERVIAFPGAALPAEKEKP